MPDLTFIEAIVDDTRIVQRLGRCTRLRGGSTCTACAEACPHGIPLSAGSQTVLDKSHGAACTACGACVAACPTEALAMSGDQVGLWIAALRDLDREQPRVRIACSAANEPDSDLEVFCLRGWDESLALWTSAYFAAGTEVALVTGDCRDCTEGAGTCSVAEWASRASDVLVALGGESRITHAVLPVPAGGQAAGRGAGLDRRSFFRSIFTSGRQRIGTHLQSRDATAAETGEEGAGTAGERRRLAVAAVRHLARRSEASTRYEYGTPGRLATLLPTANASACVACGDCVTFCPTGALSTSEAEGTWSLNLDRSRCVGCGQCARLCRTEALRLEVAMLADVVEATDATLATIDVVPCATCGQTARTGTDPPLCGTCERAATRFQGFY